MCVLGSKSLVTQLCDTGSAAVPELCREVQQLCVTFGTALWAMPEEKIQLQQQPWKENGEKRGNLFVTCDFGGRS